MKALRTLGIMMVIICGALALLLSCTNPVSQLGPAAAKAALNYPPVGDPPEIGTPGAPLQVPLYAGKDIDVGSVEVWLDGDTLCVRFASSWSLVETHLDLVSHPTDFPQTKKGNPKPGHFAHKMVHGSGVSEYTYCIEGDGFSAGDELYFAAHAEVEQWINGDCLNSESAWAGDRDFPGANWATYFAGVVPAPVSIDLTGYWVWYFTMSGQPETGPVLLYIHQTEEQQLFANIGISGFIADSTVTLYMPYYGVEMTGTVAGDLIEGPFTMAVPDQDPLTGEFRMHRATESDPPFGHLELDGLMNGVEISLDTEFALGTEVSVEQDMWGVGTHFEAHYITHEWDVRLWMSVFGTEPLPVIDPEAGDAPVTYTDIGISVRWQKNGEGLDDYWIESPNFQSLTLTRFDPDEGAAGSFYAYKEDAQGNILEDLECTFDLSWWQEWEGPEEEE